MLAFKTQININNEMLFLKLPSNFKGKRVEIIVLETNDLDDKNLSDNIKDTETFYSTFSIAKDDKKPKSSKINPNDFQKLLLTAPTWSDEEYQNFIDTRKLFNQWNID